MEPEQSEKKSIYTYHCICSHLVVATTTPLEKLERRSAGSIGQELILPLTSSQSELRPGDTELPRENLVDPVGRHYALLLSVFTDRKPKIIARSDGFEKRWLQRCGRCKSTIGYQLDYEQFRETDSAKTSRREDVVYLINDGLRTTSRMTEAEYE